MKMSACLGVLAVFSSAGCAASTDTNAPQPTPPASSALTTPQREQSASTTASPVQPSTGEREDASPKTKPTVGSSAVFRHFKVAVSKVERRSDSQVVVRAQVCVRSLPPDPQGNRTRISWDPWSVRAGNQTVDAELAGPGPDGLFPRNATYAVGDCALGWIPFRTKSGIGEITYENGIGDRAVWDADRLTQPPTKSQDDDADAPDPRPASIGEGTFIVDEDVRPGRYKAGASGGGSCYWARLRDDSGETESIIANSITGGSAVVTIKSSDGAFETNGCSPWVRQ